MQHGPAPLKDHLTVVLFCFTRLNTLLPYNPTIKLLGIYPKELKTYIHTKICTQMSTAALLIISKTWKQPRCPSVCEWVNKWCYIQTTEYYSALKREELSIHENTWRKLRCVLSENSQTERATTVWFQLEDTLEKGKNMETRASLVAQWLRIRLPMQATRVRALVWEDPTCHGATGPVRHNYWACASGACAPQQERPRQWEACAPRWRVAPLTATRESPGTETKTQHCQKIN